jgi:hypothetical protein
MGFVRTNVSEELRASIIRVTRIGELGTSLAVKTSNLVGCPSNETSDTTFQLPGDFSYAD